MTLEEFIKLVRELCQVPVIIHFPPLADSAIVRTDYQHIWYRRGRSTIKISIRDMWEATEHFAGERVTTNEIRTYRPHVFDSHARPAGHSCNLTFLFAVLLLLKIATDLQGKGRRGSPYSIHIGH
jgi:hypothetical protein